MCATVANPTGNRHIATKRAVFLLPNTKKTGDIASPVLSFFVVLMMLELKSYCCNKQVPCAVQVVVVGTVCVEMVQVFHYGVTVCEIDEEMCVAVAYAASYRQGFGVFGLVCRIFLFFVRIGVVSGSGSQHQMSYVERASQT